MVVYLVEAGRRGSLATEGFGVMGQSREYTRYWVTSKRGFETPSDPRERAIFVEYFDRVFKVLGDSRDLAGGEASFSEQNGFTLSGVVHARSKKEARQQARDAFAWALATAGKIPDLPPPPRTLGQRLKAHELAGVGAVQETVFALRPVAA